jgi:amino acid transporter
MASIDRSVSAGTAIGAERDRPVRLDWSALFAGTIIGWGAMLLFSLVGMILGLSVIDPFASRPVASTAGAAIWGALSAGMSSFIGAFAVVRLAGERRRSESLVHGVVSWGMSLLLAGLIALFAAGVAAFTRTPVRNTAVGKGARGQTAALVATTGNGPLIAISATGGALLALVGSMLASVAAASRSSGVPLSQELRLWRRGGNGDRLPGSPLNAGAEEGRDQTTILPPTH